VAQPPHADFDPGALLDVLASHGVDFVLIGGLAGIAHGSAYNTVDMDIAYARDEANLERLATALRAMGASLRGAPAGLPLQLDATTLRSGMNFTFTTRFGAFDILGEATGAPSFEELRAAGRNVDIRGRRVRVASLDHLIAMKEAAGRPKDSLMATEYRLISDELRAPKNEA
jgi:hypothetical protein